jgi:hypothetical protein
MGMNMFAAQDKAKPGMENIRGLNLAVVMWLSFRYSVSKIGMIYFAKPGLTEDSYVVHKEELSVTCHMCDTYTDKGGSYS